MFVLKSAPFFDEVAGGIFPGGVVVPESVSGGAGAGLAFFLQEPRTNTRLKANNTCFRGISSGILVMNKVTDHSTPQSNKINARILSPPAAPGLLSPRQLPRPPLRLKYRTERRQHERKYL